jgi:hypothetical protein
MQGWDPAYEGIKINPSMQEMPGVWAHWKVLLKGTKMC